MIREALVRVVEGESLGVEEAYRAMKAMVADETSPVLVGAFLTALRVKGEVVEELVGFARAMMDLAHRIRPSVDMLADTCGTGGDGAKTVNISTMAAFVVAGAGVPVAKHGNRAVTSRCGSADVLEALGYNLELAPQEVEALIGELGVGFLFAPRFHPAMKRVAPIRRELALRTVFNLLGPLTNPAGPRVQLIGVYQAGVVELVAQALQQLGRRGVVVHGDGLDEFNLAGRNLVALVGDEGIRTLELGAKDLGLAPIRLEELVAEDPQAGVLAFFQVLYGLDRGARRRAVVANAALTLSQAAGVSLKEAVALAEEALESGRAYHLLRELVKRSRGDLSVLEGLEQRYG